MPTREEYAQMALRVYLRSEENRTPVPAGWIDERPWIDDRPNGFSAGVYKRGNEIVIAYASTNQRLAADFYYGNVPAATGLSPSEQVWAAKSRRSTGQATR